MTGRLCLKRWRSRLPVAVLGLGLSLGVASCSNGPPALGANFTPAAATTAGDYTLPLDSVPTSDGKTFYFTAMSNNGSDMGVYRVDAAGGPRPRCLSARRLSRHLASRSAAMMARCTSLTRVLGTIPTIRRATASQVQCSACRLAAAHPPRCPRRRACGRAALK